MGTVLVVVAQVALQQADQMRFISDHSVIREVPPEGADHPLAIPVLPRGPEPDLLRSDAQRLHEGTRGPEDRVPVEQEVGRKGRHRGRHREAAVAPIPRWVGGDAYLPNHPPPVVQDHQDIEQPEVLGRHHQEVHRRNQLSVIIEKGLPGLGPLGIVRPSGHPARHAAFGGIEPQLQQFPMDAGRTPKRVFLGHLGDQVAQT